MKKIKIILILMFSSLIIQAQNDNKEKNKKPTDKETIKTLQQEIKKLEEDNIEKSKRIKSLREENIAIKTELENDKDNYEILGKDIAEKKSRISNLQSKLSSQSELESQLKTEQNKTKKLEKYKNIIQKEVIILNEEINHTIQQKADKKNNMKINNLLKRVENISELKKYNIENKKKISEYKKQHNQINKYYKVFSDEFNQASFNEMKKEFENNFENIRFKGLQKDIETLNKLFSKYIDDVCYLSGKFKQINDLVSGNETGAYRNANKLNLTEWEDYPFLQEEIKKIQNNASHNSKINNINCN